MVLGEDYNPFQAPSVDSFDSDAIRQLRPVPFVWIAVGTVVAAVVFAYAALLAEFFPSLPRPQVPFAGLSAFTIAISVICGFAGRGRETPFAWLSVVVILVFGWGLLLATIHLVLRSGLHWRDFSIIGWFFAASAGGAVLSMVMRNWRRERQRANSSSSRYSPKTQSERGAAK